MSARPTVRGPVDGNAFSVIAAVRAAIREFYPADEVEALLDEYTDAATSGDYNNLLAVSAEYADFELGA